MKKLLISFNVLSFLLLIVSCEKDEIEQQDDATNTTTSTYDSRLRVESGLVSGDHDVYGTYAESFLDFDGEEVYEFSFNMTDNIELTESTILVGINMYSDNKIFQNLIEDTSYYFEESWIAGGPKDKFSVGMTIWDENHENATIYSDVIDGSILLTDVGSSKIRAMFNFELASHETNDTIKTKTSLLIAYPE